MEAERINALSALLNDLTDVKPNFGGIFDFDKKSEKLEQVNEELEDPTVWNDPKRAQDLGKEKKALEAIVTR